MADTGKLITPVQYERPLDDLNEIRPLSRVDTVRRMVSLPVIKSNPISGVSAVQGKLLRCDDFGVLTEKGRTGFTSYETHFIYYYDVHQHHIARFSKVAPAILFRATGATRDCTVWLSDDEIHQKWQLTEKVIYWRFWNIDEVFFFFVPTGGNPYGKVVINAYFGGAISYER